MSNLRKLALLVSIAVPLVASAEPSSTGQTGLIHMPDGRVEADGTLRGGFSYMDPYAAVWSSVTLVPWLEVSGRFSAVEGVEAFGGNTGYGSYKDKSFDAKVRLLEESEWLPALAVGRQDFVGDSVLFRGTYLAASKEFAADGLGRFDLTAGFGDGRFDGAFGGVRWYQPWLPNIALVAEYDGYAYDEDFRAQRTGVVEREGGFGVGIEYRRGWVAGQLAHQDGHLGLNVGVTVPLQQRTFTPKVDEPPPVELVREREPVLGEWQANDPQALLPMVQAITREGFRTSRVRVEGDRIEVAASISRMSTVGRVAGRIARVVAGHAPAGVNRLALTLSDSGVPMITYEFGDLAMYRAWLDGRASPEQLQATLSATYVDSGEHADLLADGLRLEDLYEYDGSLRVRTGSWLYAFPMTISRRVPNPIVLRIRPVNFGFIFNDPNGAFRYELYSMVTATKWLTDGLYATAGARATIHDTYDGVVGRSNSLLPHVRSDFVEYKLESNRVKLDSMYIAQIANPRDRVYTWLSAGIYEEMYAGAGGEVLYLPQTGNWAADFAAYRLRQRDFTGAFGFQDYDTTTALASFHYRFPRQGVTFTARAGRFLAKDTGVRFEFRRRFLSGFEIGAWYTHTNANDITSPGSPSDPYQDKGIFVRYAIGPMLPFDSGAGVEVQMAPWQRDPGQMARTPGGLYGLFERSLLLNLDDLGPWSDLGH